MDNNAGKPLGKRQEDERYLREAAKRRNNPGAAGASGGVRENGADIEGGAGASGGISGNAPGKAARLSGEEPPIGRKEILKATETLKKYKQGKNLLERKVIENEQFWKLRHWETARTSDRRHIPATAWLWNTIVSKHADAMDGIPEPNILPREEQDKAEAEILTSIVPVILKQNDFEKVYNDVQWYKLKQGTGVYGVFWDAGKHNGLGDVSVQKCDLLSCFWEPGVTDIQNSANFFTVSLVDNEKLESQYPFLKDKLSSPTLTLSKYRYDDTVDVSDKSAVVDWYYKKYQNGKQVLHYCKYVNDAILFATENEPDKYPDGWYAHGKYPFVFDSLFDIEGSPCGYSYTDICKDTQIQIDELSDAVVQNALMGAKRRYFIKGNGSVNEEEFADWNNDFVHVYSGSLGDDSLREINVSNLGGVYLNVLENKINELKETSGNQDVSNGAASASVTAASAIAALQEAAGKTSRDFLKTTYNAYEEIITFVIELIRQFYDVGRQFRITGERGKETYVSYSNANIKNVQQGADGDMFGVSVGYRVPEFDIEVIAQKQTAYSKMSQNELALQFYNAGFFNPELSDQALACLDMMEFSRKDFIEKKISENGTMATVMAQYRDIAEQLAATFAPDLLPRIEAIGQKTGQTLNGNADMSSMNTDALGGYKPREFSGVTKARQQAAESTQVG